MPEGQDFFFLMTRILILQVSEGYGDQGSHWEVASISLEGGCNMFVPEVYSFHPKG